MTEPGDKPDFLSRATDEIKGMGRDGLSHPSTKPVLGGAALGAVAAILLPVLTIPIGIVGAAVGALSSSNAGRNLNIVLIIIFTLRLMLGGGII